MEELNKFYSGKKVLLTGASGFIGSHVLEQLVLSGANVTALLHYNGSNEIGNLKYVDEKIVSQVKIVFGDITDSFQMYTLVKGQDLVLHLAALIGIPYSYVAPAAYVSTNINGTLNILEAVRKNDVQKLEFKEQFAKAWIEYFPYNKVKEYPSIFKDYKENNPTEYKELLDKIEFQL